VAAIIALKKVIAHATVSNLQFSWPLHRSDREYCRWPGSRETFQDVKKCSTPEAHTLTLVRNGTSGTENRLTIQSEHAQHFWL